MINSSKVLGIFSKVRNLNHEASLLLLRTGVVSLIYFATVTVILAIGGKSTVALFVQVQNSCFMISSIASFGLYSVLLYYGSRSSKLAGWSVWQMLVWSPFCGLVCFASAAVLEVMSPSVGVVSLAVFSFTFTMSTVVTGLYLGIGRFSFFAIVEVIGAVVFFLIVLLFERVAKSSYELNVLYSIILALKFGIYVVGVRDFLPPLSRKYRAKHRARLRPSAPLIRRFAGPSWVSGALYVLAYRLLLTLFQGTQGVAAIDVAVCWAIFDRLQMVIQVVNTLAFRSVAGRPSNAQKVVEIASRTYPLLGGATIVLIAVGILIWTHLSNSRVSLSALLVGLVFFAWGYRAIIQNVLSALRQYNRIIFDLSGLLILWCGILLLEKIVYVSWYFALTVICLAIIASAFRMIYVVKTVSRGGLGI